MKKLSMLIGIPVTLVIVYKVVDMCITSIAEDEIEKYYDIYPENYYVDKDGKIKRVY